MEKPWEGIIPRCQKIWEGKIPGGKKPVIHFGQFKGHTCNSGVPRGIWQVIELARDIMPTNIFTKFDKDRMKTL